MLFIVGKSGAGKSTLLNLIGGLDQPTSGKIIHHGVDFTDCQSKRSTSYIRHMIGFMFQDYSLIEDMDVYDNLSLAISHLGLNRETIEKRISNALDEVDLSGYDHRKITELSGGEQQRVAIARAIVKDASIILCDEPTGNLDLENAARSLDILKDLSKNKLIVVVTHNEILANKYADRIIRLEDGTVVQDSRISEKNIENMNEVLNSSDKIPEKRRAFSFFNNLTMKLIWMDFKKHLVSTIISIFVFCVSISLLITFSAVSNYNSYDTFIDTLEYNEQYLVKVTTYIDNSIFLGDQLYMYGLFPTYELMEEEDSATVEELTGNLLTSYKSYYFLKNFQDFLDYRLQADKYGSYASYAYRTSYFTDMIIIEDFSGFNQPLLNGSYPEADNEILIYDFMAFQLMETNALTGVARMEDMIDYVLTDKDTGFAMKICGILQSDYEKYSYTDGKKSMYYPFESLYLSELQSIFALPGFLDLVESDAEITSINSLSVYNGSQQETSQDVYIRKVQLVNNIDSFDFIVEPTVDEGRGIILSNYQLADLLDMNVSEITFDFLRENVFEGRIKTAYLYQKAYLSKIGSRVFNIIGVYNADELNEEFIYSFFPTNNSNFTQNGNFRNLFLSLDDNWEINRNALTEFAYPNQKDMSFYYENPNFEEVGWMEYTPFTGLIQETDQYMEGMQKVGIQLKIVVVFLSLFVILNYMNRWIQKSTYKIGVMKSLGYSNTYIAIIYGIKMMLVMTASFVLVIPCAIYMTRAINMEFANIMDYDLVFFSLGISDFILSFVMTTFVSAFVLIIPLTILIRKTPIRIINRGKEGI